MNEVQIQNYSKHKFFYTCSVRVEMKQTGIQIMQIFVHLCKER
jgi:hypothetical protein